MVSSISRYSVTSPVLQRWKRWLTPSTGSTAEFSTEERTDRCEGHPDCDLSTLPSFHLRRYSPDSLIRGIHCRVLVIQMEYKGQFSPLYIKFARPYAGLGICCHPYAQRQDDSSKDFPYHILSLPYWSILHQSSWKRLRS